MRRPGAEGCRIRILFPANNPLLRPPVAGSYFKDYVVSSQEEFGQPIRMSSSGGARADGAFDLVSFRLGGDGKIIGGLEI